MKGWIKAAACGAVALGCLSGAAQAQDSRGQLYLEPTGHLYFGIVPRFRAKTLPIYLAPNNENTRIPLGPLTDTNSVLAQLEVGIATSDRLCNNYFSDISMSERTWNAATTVASVGFSTVQTTARFDGTIHRAAAGALASTGLRSVAKDQVLGGSSSFLLTKAVQKYRRHAAEALRTDVRSGALSNATAATLLAVLQDYHSTCTVNQALVELNDSVSDDSPPPSGGPQAAGGGSAGATPAATVRAPAADAAVQRVALIEPVKSKLAPPRANAKVVW